MKVKEVLSYLQTLNPDCKVTMKVESRTGELEQREIFMIEDAYWGRANPRVIFYPGRRAPDSERKRRVRCRAKNDG
jgi:hypothetical protein